MAPQKCIAEGRQTRIVRRPSAVYKRRLQKNFPLAVHSLSVGNTQNLGWQCTPFGLAMHALWVGNARPLDWQCTDFGLATHGFFILKAAHVRYHARPHVPMKQAERNSIGSPKASACAAFHTFSHRACRKMQKMWYFCSHLGYCTRRPKPAESLLTPHFFPPRTDRTPVRPHV